MPAFTTFFPPHHHTAITRPRPTRLGGELDWTAKTETQTLRYDPAWLVQAVKKTERLKGHILVFIRPRPVYPGGEED